MNDPNFRKVGIVALTPSCRVTDRLNTSCFWTDHNVGRHAHDAHDRARDRRTGTR